MEFQIKDQTTRKQGFPQALSRLNKWLYVDAKEQHDAGMDDVPMLFDKETDTFRTAVAETFKTRVKFGRRLVLKGRKAHMVKDREERDILNQIKKNAEVQDLYTFGMEHVHQRWDRLQNHPGVENEDDFVYVLDVLDLMKCLAKWKNKGKAEKQIKTFVENVKDHRKRCRMRKNGIHGRWTLPNKDGSPTVVTIRNSQFVPDECHGDHWNHCQYFVDSIHKNEGRLALKVIGGKGSHWRRRFHQMWYLQDNFEMHVIPSDKSYVCHKWTQVDVATSDDWSDARKREEEPEEGDGKLPADE